MSVETLSTRRPNEVRIGYWISTVLFCLLMSFSAVMYLTSPMMAEAFKHLGFPPYFRVELAIAKLIGVVTLLAPAPNLLKQWAYAGFGITLISAIIAHTKVDGPSKAVPPIVAAVILVVSYVTWKRGHGGTN